jgi:tetratricopeptide (TPR) repeat protein
MSGKSAVSCVISSASAMVVVIALSGSVVLALPNAVTPGFEDGVKLYRQNQYKQALPVFLEFLKANPRSAAAYLYIANCYYGLQQISLAKQTYQTLIQSFPNSSEASAARNFLQKLQPSSPSSQLGISSTSSSSTAASSSNPKTSISPRVAADSKIGPIALRIIRPLQDHPAVSAQLISEVQSRLQAYPKSVKKLLFENRIEVVLTTTLIDKNPEMKNEEGRGYDGHTLKSCPGMFQGGRSIVICERTMDENTEAIHDPLPLTDILSTLNHETGHAIDSCLGDLCETEEYKHAYLLDAASAQRNDPSVARDLAYYLQKSVAGQQECCGELFGIILGTEDSRSDKMKAAFPQTMKLLKLKLGL